MSVNLKRLNLLFDIADAECPEIRLFDGDSLQIKFLDYRESWVKLEFLEVIAFEWNSEEIENQNLSDDCVYEVINSKRIESYRRVGEPVFNHKHYKLCFNACGILDIIFSELRIIESPYLQK